MSAEQFYSLTVSHPNSQPLPTLNLVSLLCVFIYSTSLSQMWEAKQWETHPKCRKSLKCVKQNLWGVLHLRAVTSVFVPGLSKLCRYIPLWRITSCLPGVWMRSFIHRQVRKLFTYEIKSATNFPLKGRPDKNAKCCMNMINLQLWTLCLVG